jgi:hypothetical protein
MAEIGSVIIVGCCPSIPRILRRHQISSTSASGGYSYDHSASKPKAKSRFNTVDANDNGTELRSSSEVRLEMYGYANSIERAGSEDDAMDGRDGIVKPTHISHMPVHTDDVKRHTEAR